MNRLTDLLHIEVPLIQAPMAGAGGVALAAAAASAGALGSLPCAMLSIDDVRRQVAEFRRVGDQPLNLNFFCHRPPADDARRSAAWNVTVAPYFAEFGVDHDPSTTGPARGSFDSAMCEVVEDLKPEVVSFHFGLPDKALVDRVRACGAVMLSSATSVAEARWLQDHGVDAVIAQGSEAGGHRGMFLSADISTQMGTFSLVPQVVDAVGVPVIAAGGITDGRGIAAAMMLGADGVQVGTGLLLTPEALTTPVHRAALAHPPARDTALTNVFTGRPARSMVNRAVKELGPMSDDVPEFPTPAGVLVPIRMAAESAGSDDFTPLWAGQSASLAASRPAAELIGSIVAEARRLLGDGHGAGFDPGRRLTAHRATWRETSPKHWM